MCGQTPSKAKAWLRERDLERIQWDSKTGNKEKQGEKLDSKKEIGKRAKGSVETERGQDSERERVCRGREGWCLLAITSSFCSVALNGSNGGGEKLICCLIVSFVWLSFIYVCRVLCERPLQLDTSGVMTHGGGGESHMLSSVQWERLSVSLVWLSREVRT